MRDSVYWDSRVSSIIIREWSVDSSLGIPKHGEGLLKNLINCRLGIIMRRFGRYLHSGPATNRIAFEAGSQRDQQSSPSDHRYCGSQICCSPSRKSWHWRAAVSHPTHRKSSATASPVKSTPQAGYLPFRDAVTSVGCHHANPNDI